jgi:hypothetical protein
MSFSLVGDALELGGFLAGAALISRIVDWAYRRPPRDHDEILMRGPAVSGPDRDDHGGRARRELVPGRQPGGRRAER